MLIFTLSHYAHRHESITLSTVGMTVGWMRTATAAPATRARASRHLRRTSPPCARLHAPAIGTLRTPARLSRNDDEHDQARRDALAASEALEGLLAKRLGIRTDVFTLAERV